MANLVDNLTGGVPSHLGSADHHALCFATWSLRVNSLPHKVFYSATHLRLIRSVELQLLLVGHNRALHAPLRVWEHARTQTLLSPLRSRWVAPYPLQFLEVLVLTSFEPV